MNVLELLVLEIAAGLPWSADRQMDIEAAHGSRSPVILERKQAVVFS
jgi:hypothetical protein